MSTSLETSLVNLFSRWLAGHVSDDDLLREVEDADADADGLTPDQAAAVRELRASLAGAPTQGERERAVRETLETLALD